MQWVITNTPVKSHLLMDSLSKIWPQILFLRKELSLSKKLLSKTS